MSLLFKNLRLLDPRRKEARAGYEVLVEGDTIKKCRPSRSRRRRPTSSIAASAR